MRRQTVAGLLILLLALLFATVLLVVRARIWRSPKAAGRIPATPAQPAPQATQDGSRDQSAEPNPASLPVSNVATSPTLEDNSQILTAKTPAGWKNYVNSQYGFEIAYPADWQLNVRYEDNYGKPPSGNRRAAYAGETRNLLNLEMDGPSQSLEAGGDFADGAIVTMRITGTSAIVEDWNIRQDHSWYLVNSSPSDWVKLESSSFGGDKVEKVPVDTNGFTGAIEVACNGYNPCAIFGEAGGAYRVLPSGRALLVSWERMNIANDLSYQKYFLPMLSSFRLSK